MANIYQKSFNRIFVVGSCFFIGASAFAEPYTTIQTPPDLAIASIASKETLQQLVLANLIVSNCKITDLTTGDAALLAGTAQAVAEHMEISSDKYFSDYIHPAMSEIAAPDSCNRYAGAARDRLAHVKELGGTIINK
jgi:hypothetical protein